jgi:hypothetical protein
MHTKKKSTESKRKPSAYNKFAKKEMKTALIKAIKTFTGKIEAVAKKWKSKKA